MKEKKLLYYKNQEPPKIDEVFTDSLFPPTDNSLFALDSSGKPIDKEVYEKNTEDINKLKKAGLVFLRMKDIFGDDYSLFSEQIEIDDIIQGNLGNCYFMTAVSNLCKFPNKVKQMFKQNSKNEKGFYEIEVFIDGKKQIVIVDDYIPAYKESKQLVFAKSNKKKIWVILLEKAWAKVNGGYVNTISGRAEDALEFLTGRGSLVYNFIGKEGDELNEYKKNIIKEIQLIDKNNCVMSCSTKDVQEIKDLGLVVNHAYSLLDFVRIETNKGEIVYLFKLRNPWSKGEWKGEWSDDSNLWDEKTKEQVQLKNKDDGIFFMKESDFFKYFIKVEISYLFLDSEDAIYEIEGEENLKNAGVFIIEVEEDGFLSVSIPRENWRYNRTIKGKNLPTHLSIVKYELNSKNRFKTFSCYKGNYNSKQCCTVNSRISKGNYLIYVYRDFSHAEYSSEKKVTVKITCSSKFKHAQMSYDEKEKGFPLLHNIILQAAFEEWNYDPDSGNNLNQCTWGIKGNGIGCYIRYIPTPGFFYKLNGKTDESKGFFYLTPYLESKATTFHKKVPSGKYFIILAMRTGIDNSTFMYYDSAYITANSSDIDYFNYDIDLNLYLDFNNNIKSANLKEKKEQSLTKYKKEFYTETTNGEIEFKSLEELEKEYGNYLKLLDEIKIKDPIDNLKWGIVKSEYNIFIGQFSGKVRSGKGLFITPNNIFAGEFRGHWQNGKGYTYNKNFQKLFYCIYQDCVSVKGPVSFEEELEQIEIEKKEEERKLKEEQERLLKLKEEKEALLKKKEKELVIYLIKPEEIKKKYEMELALKKAEEEAIAEKKRIEEEKRKELEKKKAELERIEKEKQQKIEEAKKKAEEYKKEQENLAKKILQKAMQLKLEEKENIKKELENIQREETELVNKKEQELKEKEKQIEEEQQIKKNEIEQKLNEIEKKAKENEEKLIDYVNQEIQEELQRLEVIWQIAVKRAEKMIEEEDKKIEEKKKEAEEKEKELKLKEEKNREETKQQMEEIRNQLKKTEDEKQKIEKEIQKNMTERKKTQDEKQKIIKRKQEEMEKLEKKTKEENFGVDIIYPDYLKKEPEREQIKDKYISEAGRSELCVTCGCNIL